MSAPLAHFGTFDVANFGDLLFPLVLERRLGDLGPIVHVSPVGGPPPIADGVATIAPAHLPERLAGVVVGGGHLIHCAPSALPAYARPRALALTAYPELWLGAAERALRAGAPLVWNAPGAPAAFAPRAAPAVAWATGFADLLAVRDENSRTRLREAGCTRDVDVVPDTALEVSRLFSAQTLDEAYSAAFATRRRERCGPTLAFHANTRDLADEVPAVAARIDRICAALGATPILLSLGPCHGDDALVRSLAEHMRSRPLVVDRPASLRELVACIARSQAYVGSSLHGCITACAFGVRSAIVAREPEGGGKFSGFLGQFRLDAWRLRDWSEAEARAASLWHADPEPWRRVERDAAPPLDRHWTRLRAALETPPSQSAARARADDERSARLHAELASFGITSLLLAHHAELAVEARERLAQQRAQTLALKASYRDQARALRRRIEELESDRSAQLAPERSGARDVPLPCDATDEVASDAGASAARMNRPSLPKWISRWLEPSRSEAAMPRGGRPAALSRQQLDRLAALRTQLLVQKRWSYLRYVHLREGLLSAQDVGSVLSVGAGRGVAELALAVEFPEIRFVITDVASETTPNYQWAVERARKWQLPNVEFGLLDVTQPIAERFDLVASVEVIEHIEDDALAASHMTAAARRYVFCLVPFADDATLADPRHARRAWERQRHYRFGYSPERLRTLFGEPVAMRGCYFRESGLALRQTLDASDDETIRARVDELAAHARADVDDALPKDLAHAQGIWILSRSAHDTDTPSVRSLRTLPTPGPTHSESMLHEVRRRLVFYRSWSYFRYLHMREAFLATEGVKSVLSIGSGRGLAELALAVEFPDVRFLLTDVRSPHTSSSEQVMAMARSWGLGNLERIHHDILEPLAESYDLVASVEVLEHIQDHERAAHHMREASRRYTFCLVPFADARAAADPERRRRAWEKDHHYRFGYCADDLRSLFPDPVVALRGCYWQAEGASVVAENRDVSDEALLEKAPAIWAAARRDLIDRVPTRYPEAFGIWILTARAASA